MNTPLLTLEIPRHLNDKRVDAALAALLSEKYPQKPRLSRAVLARFLTKGRIRVNGATVLPRSLVATHDTITLPESVWDETVLLPSSLPVALTVVFENTAILVLDKGAGVQMHPGGTRSDTTVAQWLLAQYPDLASVGEDPLRPGIVHRLDRDTSGVFVVAKTNESFQALKQLFQDREVEKKYVALVQGHLESQEGKVTASLMRRPGELKRRAVDTETFQGTLPGNTRSALTYYHVIASLDECDLVELTPKTGRTHQIRVHLAFLGHPVVGDKLYGFKETKQKSLPAPSRQMLHAARIAFTLFGEKYQFEAPLPEDFRQVLRGVGATLPRA